MRIGIFGGTFDPPHLGHLVLAAEAMEQMKLESVYWVLTPDPPHKKRKQISPFSLRADMVKAAIERFAEFHFSDIESLRPGPHYAVDTVREFHRQLPGTELFYVMGEDALDDLPVWHDSTGFVTACDGIIVMEREGEVPDWNKLNAVLPALRAKTHLLKTPIVEISSHEIRERVKHDRTWRAYVVTGVEAIIIHNQLYR